MLKSLPKIITIFFLTIFIFQLACLLFLTLAPNISQAADPATFKPQVQIPGMAEEFGATDKTGGYAIPGSTASIAKYVRVVYKYAIGIVGILAAVVLMVGGVMWIVAGGNSTAIGEAKSWIGASLTGLVLALMSYLILATINPALVDLKTTQIKTVAPSLTTNFDASKPCGQQTSGQVIVCGSKCPSGQTCEKVTKGTTGAKQCPETLSSTGNGDYYLCSSLSGGGTNCCNASVSCPSGYICNTSVPQAQLLLCKNISSPTGICVANSVTGGGIQENQICTGLENQCATGLHCSTADNRCRPVNWENSGIVNDPCGASTQENFKCTTADTILGIPKCPSGYTHYGFGGRSCGSNLMCCKKD